MLGKGKTECESTRGKNISGKTANDLEDEDGSVGMSGQGLCHVGKTLNHHQSFAPGQFDSAPRPDMRSPRAQKTKEKIEKKLLGSHSLSEWVCGWCVGGCTVRGGSVHGVTALLVNSSRLTAPFSALLCQEAGVSSSGIRSQRSRKSWGVREEARSVG